MKVLQQVTGFVKREFNESLEMWKIRFIDKPRFERACRKADFLSKRQRCKFWVFRWRLGEYGVYNKAMIKAMTRKGKRPGVFKQGLTAKDFDRSAAYFVYPDGRTKRDMQNDKKSN